VCRKQLRLGLRPWMKSPLLIYLLCLLLAYIAMILITESFFDRYQLPIILITILLFSFLGRKYLPRISWALLPLLCLFYVSVFGTRDYFSWNSKRWQAVGELVQDQGIPLQEINGGAEVNCWNDGKPGDWYTFMYLHTFDYLIQYR